LKTTKLLTNYVQESQNLREMQETTILSLMVSQCFTKRISPAKSVDFPNQTNDDVIEDSPPPGWQLISDPV